MEQADAIRSWSLKTETGLFGAPALYIDLYMPGWFYETEDQLDVASAVQDVIKDWGYLAQVISVNFVGVRINVTQSGFNDVQEVL